MSKEIIEEIDINKNPDKKLTRKDFLGWGFGTAVISALTYLTAQPFRDLKNTLRIIDALSGNQVDCYIPTDNKERNYPFDAIVVPGGGIDITPEGLTYPNEFQQLRLEAAAISFVKNKAPLVVLLDGELDPRVDPLMDKRWLQAKVTDLSQGDILLPDEFVFVDYESINTATNMRYMSGLAELRGIESQFLITNDFHLQRATYYACYFGLNTKPQSAEEIIIDYDPTREIAIQQLYESQKTKYLYRKERNALMESLIDPSGALPTLLKRFTLP
ncbi:hypothetical protein A2863_03075 [Candidatus Woesebacteria bacterium RIFCSPHIGHO2_01_FULL_38_9b]|uniref:DUF218 domain-containing protein n=1 Tax=Candidatus Woesebacteria bacterium RIFCSPHIGHO2_01_FULL_38_9b TaxID=1802493 RepID=A0A1F7Y1D6_9BACT|nr:MAG: hypothetical protein A2863_03075 [Candidatus Woesebacteria bacterium RIFCSPHIGHO2_01_FULL_38_9b]